MKVVGVGVGAAALILGLGSLLLAHDIRSWDRALHRGDAAFAVQAGRAQWSAGTWLPGGAAVDVLGLGDDLALRRAEQAFVVARAAPTALDNGRRQARLRAEAELALSNVVATGSPVEASRAGNLLGILAATTAAGADASVSERQASETFDAAVRADPSSTDGKYNLELLLRRVHVVGSREGVGAGAGDRGDSLSGAGSGKAGSGY